MRKKRHEEHVNHEAWAIPYADLMTLLLAFFVVMYAVSVVNAGKFRVMSASMSEAFNGGGPLIALPAGAHSPEAGVIPSSRSSSPVNAPIQLPIMQRAAAVHGKVAHLATLEQIEGKVQRVLQPLIDKKLVALRRTPDRLEIEIGTDILFPSGVATLSKPATQVLLELGKVLAPFPNPLRVEGFTDNVPISTPLYPSNWELSAARAARVARLFADDGVSPTRLGILGWGEVRPVASNATAEGRNRNRRVLVVVQNELSEPPNTGASASTDGRQADLGQGGRSELPTQYGNAPAAAVDRAGSFDSAASHTPKSATGSIPSTVASATPVASSGTSADTAVKARSSDRLPVVARRGDNGSSGRAVPAAVIRQ
jgi:chemotaxis protein MotB